ncbi:MULTISPECIES: hypothetical protein [unclassified Rhizobium]|uniref:hypothetical protein n=1 Tax=unclassified Rhizobium TaxID=2613769 RepID=UPI0010508E20|nr:MULTISPECIES: hypothetical protein [unclassified Rhizobium]MBB3393804.1 hypothetical protein [Rhizobium sp. BK060]MBB4169215.1 hypothetical protein [Rhizobium sp. BK538]
MPAISNWNIRKPPAPISRRRRAGSRIITSHGCRDDDAVGQSWLRLERLRARGVVSGLRHNRQHALADVVQPDAASLQELAVECLVVVDEGTETEGEARASDA